MAHDLHAAALASQAEIGIIFITAMRWLIYIVLLPSAACVREHVDLNRACASDNDCIAGYTCKNGMCTSAGWYDGRYPQRILLTIPAGTTSAVLTDVPVPVHLTSAQLTTAGINPTTLSTDGHDIAITDTSNIPLPFQIESWDTTRGYVVWVKLPTVSASADTQLYLYLGNIKGSAASTTAVWDSGFVGVWHLAETSGTTFEDATSNAHEASGRAAAIANSIFGAGQQIAIGDTIKAVNVSIDTNAPLTLEGWFTAEGDAFHYRRELTSTVPTDDMEVLWPIPDDDGFKTRTDTYANIQTVDGSETAIPYATIKTDHGYELWTRAVTQGATTQAVVYGNDTTAENDTPEAVFHFWAFDTSWSAFTQDPTAVASTNGTSLVVTSGRLSTQLPFDLRDGFFIQTYADFLPSSSNSGGLPFVADRPNPVHDLTTPASVAFLSQYPDDVHGFLRTATGRNAGLDGAVYIAMGNDIGLGIANNQISAFSNQSWATTLSCAWINPLEYLLLGSYDGTEPVDQTTYKLIFVRRWPGASAIATASAERVNGIALGDFGISAGAHGIYYSTNSGVAVVTPPTSSSSSARHVALVVHDSEYAVYVDGALSANGPVSSHGALTGLTLPDSHSLQGVLDEVRVSNVVRAPEWIAFEAQTQRADFMHVGNVETLH